MKVFLALFGLLNTVAVFGDGVVSCYWGAWANGRPGVGRFGVDDLPTDLCTHIIYSFVGLNPEGEITYLNDQNELEGKSNTLQEFSDLKQKNPNVKLLIAAGGWAESSANFTIVSNNETLRTRYAENVANFLAENNFDGFDVDWEYPNQRGGVASDREAFIYFLQALKQAFEAKEANRYQLSVAVGVTQSNVDLSYLVRNISDTVDNIHLMVYDFHGSWETTTGVNAPLYPQETDAPGDVLNVNSSLYVWLNEGADRSKIVLGLGSYGRTFTLASLNNTGTGAPATGAGNPGTSTGEAGTLAYYEICQSQNENADWSITEVTGNYVYGNLGDQWVGYDNENTVAAKAAYAKAEGLAGVYFWTADEDDFSGVCSNGEVTFPLIRSAIKGFNG